jgi:hypothetical protein
VIHTLRHIAIRLWLSLLSGTLIILLVVPLVPVSLDLNLIFILALLVLTGSFLIIGYLFNRWGLQLVERFMREAAIWERSGSFFRAETIFKKAVAIFDSFLISPVAKKKHSKRLTAHLAKFYLARPQRGQPNDIFITSYLYHYPDEQTVAEEWLQQTALVDELSPDQAELAVRIGEAQPRNQKIQTLLTRHFITAERVDYQALQVYRRFLSLGHAPDAGLILDLAELFLNHRRTDEWALKAYVMAYGANRNNKQLLPGIAACLHWLDGPSLPSPLRKKAEDFLKTLHEAERRDMAAAFAPPVRQPQPPPEPARLNWMPNVIRFVKTIMQRAEVAGKITVAVLSRAAAFTYTLVIRVRNYRHIKPVLKWGGISIAGVALIVLAANTVSFLLKAKPEPLKKEIHTAPVVTDPFTLQVAAYLKKEHAERYVDELKKAGLDAYWTEAQGVKTRWYQVRLSHFPTKDSARAYGERLKARRVINDFYVANYSR